MRMLTLAVLAMSLSTPPACPPPASLTDPAGVVMGVKYPTRGGPTLMVGVLNRPSAFERTVTPGQVDACTRWRSMAYPACLKGARTESRPS
ncbi:hypothetical protein ACBJ59_10475 [Nonomuraea sp. MTCD27]|uniref:hypothetical protein n=1 Tax=Nonomuraea sp. MTCD27 TaxID=1676747 RepID=UPI0035C1127D